MNQTIDQEIGLLRDFLDRENEIGILLGNHQNLDTYAASLALYLSLTQMGKKVQIVSKKEPTVEVSSLVGIDRVKESFGGSTGKLVVSLPYVKGEVEKVLFTEAPNTINFHLTAAPGRSITPFETRDVKLIWEGGAPTALITVGVGTTDEIAPVADPNSTKIVNIDNYQGNTRYGDVVLVDENFSSLSEVVGKIVKDLGLPIDVDIAQNIMDGVLYATRNFTKGNTSPFAFEAVSAAMYQGAQRRGEEVSQQSRRDQGFGGQRHQERPDRPDRDQRQQQRQPRVSPSVPPRSSPFDSQKNSPFDSQKVGENDFPAMHMQQRQQNENRRAQGQRFGSNQQRGQHFGRDQRENDQQFGGQNRQQSRPQQGQFGQRNDDVDELMRKIKEENARFMQEDRQNKSYPQASDAEIVEEPKNTQGQDMGPEEPQEAPYIPPAPDEIPDDWLMPKVFKSSKNNN